MGKYDPLAAFLARQRKTEVVELTFRDIERLLRSFLPKAALKPDWWAVTAPPQDEPQKRALASVGYEAEVQLRQERVRFARRRRTPSEPF